MGGGKFCSSGFCAARHSNLARDPSWTYNCSKVLFESESPAWIRKTWYEIKRSKTYETHQYVSLNMWKHAFVMVINYEQYLKKNDSYCHVFCISINLSMKKGSVMVNCQICLWRYKSRSHQPCVVVEKPCHSWISPTSHPVHASKSSLTFLFNHFFLQTIL